MNIVLFYQRVLRVHTAEDARLFFQGEVAWVRKNCPTVEDPEDMVRSNIGWVFGEGMGLADRRMWRDACGAEHPGFGPEYAEREFTPDECLRAGMRLGAEGPRGRAAGRRTAWARLLSERDD